MADVAAAVVPLGPDELAAYLERIGYAGHASPDLDTLCALHAAHLRSVPFENLDIGVVRRPIRLEIGALFDKIVGERRGGFCFETNGVFASALAGVGFDVRHMSARVHMPDGSLTPEFDHMILRVDVDEPWLADVGFGDSFVAPLRLMPDVVQNDGRGDYRLAVADGAWTLWRRTDDWAPALRFTETVRALADYQPRCDWLQTSPDSIFVQRTICTRVTDEGRITIADHRFIETVGADRTESELTDAQRRTLLAERFGIEI